ncbi:MAG TPA: hypothetical protein VFF73_25430 [Planctomycetota bacterium]|nr:hypothetical protein [Planctomycetota bacterium]
MDCTLHLVDEKQYREIYLPAVAGDEAALNQLLEWASLLSAGWESRSEAYRLVKDLRGKWKAAIEARGLGEVGRTVDFGKNLNYVYGVLSAFRRPAFYAHDFSFTTLPKIGLADLSTFVVDARILLEHVPAIPPWLPGTATGGLGQGATSGLYLPKDRVVPFLKALRSQLKQFGDKIRATGHDPEEGLAWLISACVEAKEIRPECGILELQDAYTPQTGRAAFPTETAKALATNTFPNAVLKEVRKALGTAPVMEMPPPPPPKEKLAPILSPFANLPPEPYSPQKDFGVGQKISHKKWGTGEVKKVLNHNKILVVFGSDERQLAQNQSVEPPPSDVVPAATAPESPMVGTSETPPPAPSSPPPGTAP